MSSDFKAAAARHMIGGAIMHTALLTEGVIS